MRPIIEHWVNKLDTVASHFDNPHFMLLWCEPDDPTRREMLPPVMDALHILSTHENGHPAFVCGDSEDFAMMKLCCPSIVGAVFTKQELLLLVIYAVGQLSKCVMPGDDPLKRLASTLHTERWVSRTVMHGGSTVT